jgi:hypothetical protein
LYLLVRLDQSALVLIFVSGASIPVFRCFFNESKADPTNITSSIGVHADKPTMSDEQQCFDMTSVHEPFGTDIGHFLSSALESLSDVVLQQPIITSNT